MRCLLPTTSVFVASRQGKPCMYILFSGLWLRKKISCLCMATVTNATLMSGNPFSMALKLIYEIWWLAYEFSREPERSFIFKRRFLVNRQPRASASWLVSLSITSGFLKSLRKALLTLSRKRIQEFQKEFSRYCFELYNGNEVADVRVLPFGEMQVVGGNMFFLTIMP